MKSVRWSIGRIDEVKRTAESVAMEAIDNLRGRLVA